MEDPKISQPTLSDFSKHPLFESFGTIQLVDPLLGVYLAPTLNHVLPLGYNHC